MHFVHFQNENYKIRNYVTWDEIESGDQRKKRQMKRREEKKWQSRNIEMYIRFYGDHNRLTSFDRATIANCKYSGVDKTETHIEIK